LAPDALAGRSNGVPQHPHVRRAEVGQCARLQIAPEEFGGVEIRRVGRKTFDVQPGTLRAEGGRHAVTFVRAEAIPDEHDTLAAEVPLQGAQERDERRGGIRAWVGLKVQAGAPAIPTKRERGGNRQSLPIQPGVVQDGGLAARRPRAPHDGVLRHAAFVLEDYPSVAASRVFLPPASAGDASGEWPPRPVPAPGGRAVAATSATLAGCARHARGDTGHRSAGQ